MSPPFKHLRQNLEWCHVFRSSDKMLFWTAVCDAPCERQQRELAESWGGGSQVSPGGGHALHPGLRVECWELRGEIKSYYWGIWVPRYLGKRREAKQQHNLVEQKLQGVDLCFFCAGALHHPQVYHQSQVYYLQYPNAPLEHVTPSWQRRWKVWHLNPHLTCTNQQDGWHPSYLSTVHIFLDRTHW